MKRSMQSICIVILLTTSILFFQNCSKFKIASNENFDSSSPSSDNEPSGQGNSDGDSNSNPGSPAYSSEGNYKVSWESQYHLPPQDANGWSILNPSVDSRIMYVSSSSGNDSTAQVYSLSSTAIGSNVYLPSGSIMPYASISAAMAQVRNGYPDYVLLKRGDKWTVSAPIEPKVGRSYSERSVVGYYGSQSARPFINVPDSAWEGVKYYNSGNYSAVIGIEFYGYQHDPNSPSFIGYANTNESFTGFNISSANDLHFFGVLIEDCKFNFFTQNVIQVYNNPTTYSTANVTIRRNIIMNNYSGINGKGYALYVYRQPILLEENFLDHNGWYGPATNPSTPGQANVLSQGTYVDNSSNSIVRKNMILRTGSIGMKFRADASGGQNSVLFNNILVDNNLTLEGEVALSLGGNNTYNNGPRFGNVYVVNNVAMDVGTTMPTNRGLGWGFDIQDWDTGLLSKNILAHWGSTSVNNTYALEVIGTMKNVSIKDNIFYDISTIGQWQSANPLIKISDSAKHTGTVWTNNAFDTPRGGPLLKTDGSGPTFSGNNYNTSTSGNTVTVGSSGITLSSWVTSTGEGNPSIAARSYVDSSRTAKTYLAARGQPATTAALANIVVQQSKFNWNSAYTADAINSYIREGFCVVGQPCP